MSGGSWDYLYDKVADAAIRLAGERCPHRKAFGLHLRLVAEALHGIEWVDSCDKSPGDEIEAIMKCITHEQVLSSAIQEAEKILNTLTETISEIKKR